MNKARNWLISDYRSTHRWWCQQNIQMLLSRINILARQQPQQLRRCPVFCRQQIRTARNVVQERNRLWPQPSILFKVLKMLRHPMAQDVQNTHRGRWTDHWLLPVAGLDLGRLITWITRSRCCNRECCGRRWCATPTWVEQRTVVNTIANK